MSDAEVPEQQEEKMTRTVEELADCIRKGDDPAAVLNYAVAEARQNALRSAADAIDEVLVQRRETLGMAVQAWLRKRALQH